MSGGHGSGGLRPGAGRKREDEVPDAVPMVTVHPPDDLTSAQRVVWDTWAPEAIRLNTLRPHKVAGFRLLCRALVMLDRIEAKLEADGLTQTKVTLQMDDQGGGLQGVEQKAHPLMTSYFTALTKANALLLQFKLTSIGKALPAEAEEKPKSALETLQARRIHAVK